MNTRIILFLLTILVTAPIFAADTLTIYSGRSEKLIKPAIDEFSKQTGVKVVLHAGKSAALLSKLKLEGQRTQADLFISNDAGTLETGRQQGLFQPLDNSLAQRVPANYRAADNAWVGLSARARVLVVNSNLVKPGQFNSVFDLADPAYKGKIGITRATNGSFTAGATVYIEKNNVEKVKSWLDGLKNNAGNHVYNKHSKIVADVAKGKLHAGLVNHYYIFRHLDKHPDAPIKMVMPDQGKTQMGLAWNVSGIAWVKHSNNKAAVNKLLDFMTSHEGQSIIAKLNREYPVVPSANVVAALPKLSSIKVADVPMSVLGQQRNRSVDLFESLGMK
jgi:iron(III) transport system substrate-binding protein